MYFFTDVIFDRFDRNLVVQIGPWNAMWEPGKQRLGLNVCLLPSFNLNQDYSNVSCSFSILSCTLPGPFGMLLFLLFHNPSGCV